MRDEVGLWRKYPSAQCTISNLSSININGIYFKTYHFSPFKISVLLVLSFLCAGVSGPPAQSGFASYSGEFGGNSGDYFDQSSNQLDGPITALRLRANDKYILSIQVRYGNSWSHNEGNTDGNPSSVELFLGEGFIQVLGRFAEYVEYLAFRTNLGRAVAFGPSFGSGTTFDVGPLLPNMVLRSVSGRSGPLLNAIGFHWDTDQGIGWGNQSFFTTPHK